MPYIPKHHRKYKLMPFKSAKGGEAFSYDPDDLQKAETMLRKVGVNAEPYGYSSYEEYFAEIDRGIELLSDDLEAVEKIRAFRDSMQRRNIKEVWSVLKYVGPKNEGIMGLTPDRYYYWPCSLEEPYYEGVVDNEEYTSYLHSIEKEFWEIAEDPTGMAYRTLTSWPSELDEEELEDIAKRFNDHMKSLAPTKRLIDREQKGTNNGRAQGPFPTQKAR